MFILPGRSYCTGYLQSMIKVGIIEDNKHLRNNLQTLLNAQPHMKCVLALGNLHNVVHDLTVARPEIVLMDIGLPQIGGIEGVRTLKENFLQVQVLMFTVFEDEEKIFAAIKAGASGYLLKKTPPTQLVDAIRELKDGGAPMSPAVARKVIEAMQQPKKTGQHFGLTVREKEVLHSLVEGLSYQKIADKYFVSISTVRSHVAHIYEKLHVHNRSQAAARIANPG